MLKKFCCYLCLSVNKRTININNTSLQHVYEKLADIKLYDDECWMCYICHKRLQQCHRLQQLAVQTRGLVDDLCQNKININFEAITSLLDLSKSNTKITDTTYTSLSDIKQESDINTGSSNDYEIEQDEIEYTQTHIQKVESLVKFEVKPVKIEYQEDKREHNISGLCAYKEGIQLKIEIEGKEQDEEINTEYDCYGGERANEVQSSFYNNSLSCELCSKTFLHRHKLLRHIREHTGDKPLKCELCTKTFNFSSQLVRHMKGHSGDKPFGCDICTKKFSDKNNLKKHKITHTGEKPFSCDICFKTFIQKSALTKHKRVHTGEKPFSCDVCSKQFSVKQSLENHIRTHTGDKPYSCDFCPMKFIEKSTKLNHMRIHTGEKPFMCDVCSKKFKLRAALNEHMRTHTGDKPYECDICFKKFSRTSHLYRHRKNIHKRNTE